MWSRAKQSLFWGKVKRENRGGGRERRTGEKGERGERGRKWKMKKRVRGGSWGMENGKGEKPWGVSVSGRGSGNGGKTTEIGGKKRTEDGSG
jgi:hypothetical protein